MKIEIEQTAKGDEITREVIFHAEGEAMSQEHADEMHGMVEALTDGLDLATEHVATDWRFKVTCIREGG